MPRQRARSDGPAGHLSNGKRSCENCYEGIAASSMSNTRRDTAIKCLPPSVTSVLRVLFPKGWTPPIDRGRRKAGSRSRIPRHQRRHGRKTEHSEGLAAFNHLLSGDATTRSLSRSNSRQSQHQIQRRMTDYLAPFSSLTMRPAPCHYALKSAIACSRVAE